MGTNLPRSRTAALAWIEGHLTDWNTNQAAIGLTSASVIDLTQDAANARAALTSVEQIRAASTAKTQDFYSKVDTAHKQASDMVATIKAFAENTDTPATVYALANITGKNPPTPAQPPETPAITSAQIAADGNVTIGFTGRGPTGTVWLVSRKLDTQTSYTFLGQSDGKVFIDTTLPIGVTTATYVVKGVRGTLSGLSSPPTTFQLGNVQGGAAAAA
jgi:hypothetical protein